MRNLALYCDGGALHTDGLTLDQEEARKPAVVNVLETGRPSTWERLGAAREKPDRNALMDVFSELMSGWSGGRDE